VPKTGSAVPWRGKRRVWFTLLLAALAVLVAQQIDGSVGRIEVRGQPAYAVSAVHNQSDAQRAWCVWNNYTLRPGNATGSDPAQLIAGRVSDCVARLNAGTAQASGDFTARMLVWTYIGLDLLFTLVLLLVLVYIARRWAREMQDDAIGQALRNSARGKLPYSLGALTVLGTIAETVAHGLLADSGSSSWWIGAAGNTLQFSSYVRWVPMAALATIVLVLAVAPHVESANERLQLGDTSLTYLSDVRSVAARLRLQIALTVVLILPLLGLGVDQAPDLLLRTLDLDGSRRRFWLGLLGLVLTLLSLAVLSLLLWRSVHRTLTEWRLDDDAAPRARGKPAADAQSTHHPRLVLATGVILVAAAFGWPGWRPLGGLGIVLLATSFLSLVARTNPWDWNEAAPAGAPAVGADEPDDLKTVIAGRKEPAGTAAVDRAARYARWVAAVPIAVVGIELARVSTPALLVDGSWRFGLLLILAVLLLVLAAATPTLLSSGLLKGIFQRRAAYPALAGVTAAAWVLATLPATHLGFPAVVGALGATLLFIGALLVSLTELQRWADSTVPPAGLRLLRLRRVPVFFGLLLWLVIGTSIDTLGPHQVRLQTVAKAVQPLTPHNAFEAWMADNCVGRPDAPPGDIPMVFVASSGGGIRAAYWTAAVLDKLFPLGKPTSGCTVPAASRVFAVSGISGGSLGVVSWLSSAESHGPLPWYQRPALDAADPSSATPWYEATLGIDHVSAVFSWMLYVDTPRAFLGFPGDDRAAVLEESWEDGDAALTQNFLANYQSVLGNHHGWVPLALLDGAAEESGCQEIVSPLLLDTFGAVTPNNGRAVDPLACMAIPSDTTANHKVAPAPQTTNMVGNYICTSGDRPEDVRRSTAALLSARFPYVTPSGRMANCYDNQINTYVIDGGYADGTGSLAAVNLYRQVKPWIDEYNRTAGEGHHIRPIFVQLDNGYLTQASGTPPSRPLELLVPPLGKLNAGQASENSTSQLAFSAFGGAEFYARMADIPQPGVEAPLGWALSSSARDDLAVQADRVTCRTNLPASLAWLTATDGNCGP